MKHGSLFSGIGGFDLAAEWMGWENVFQCENNLFCQKILKKNFPYAVLFGDIKQSDFTVYRGRIDILTGGFPCQPFSLAGEGKGKDDNRHLWPEMFRVIREIQPPFVIGENVPGIFRNKFKLAFEDICTSLESEGYSLQIFNIPSASIGSWDKRERIWFIAYNHRFRCDYEQKEQGETLQNRIGIGEIKKQGWRIEQCRISQSDRIVTDNSGKRNRELSIQQRGQNPPKNTDINGKTEEYSYIKTPVVKLARNTRLRRYGYSNEVSNPYKTSLQGHPWDEFTKRQKETFRRNGQATWKRNWIEVASRLCRVSNGVPNRMDRISSCGNAVNPHLVFEIFKAIEQFKDEKRNN
jgi:DNA (cytosine-5)-methyltransferase 1